MRTTLITASLALLAISVITASAQQPPSRGNAAANAKSPAAEAFVNRMLQLDADGDGKLARDEVNDARLHPLFERADSDKDGTVTKAELTSLFQKESPKQAERRGTRTARRAPQNSQDGNNPPRERRDGAQFGSPRPGQILPPFVQDALQLTDAQRKQLDELQKEVDERLGKILTAEQKQRLNERPRGPGRPQPDDEEPPGIPFDPIDIPERR